MNTKTRVKKATKRTMSKKKVTTFTGLVSEYCLKNHMDKSGDFGNYMELHSCKSSSQNHTINSFLKNNPEDNINNMVLVQVTVIGKPLVKVTREITIKK